MLKSFFEFAYLADGKYTAKKYYRWLVPQDSNSWILLRQPTGEPYFTADILAISL